MRRKRGLCLGSQLFVRGCGMGLRLKRKERRQRGEPPSPFIRLLWINDSLPDPTRADLWPESAVVRPLVTKHEVSNSLHNDPELRRRSEIEKRRRKLPLRNHPSPFKI